MDDRMKQGLKDGGRSMSQSGQGMVDSARGQAASSIRPVQYKRGGKVRKTGPAILHKNERVITAGQRKKVDRMMKRSGMRMRSGRR